MSLDDLYDDARHFAGVAKPMLTPGTTLYSTSDCGDFFNGRRVTIPKGIMGVFLRFYERNDGYCVSTMAQVAIPESPGHKILECIANEVDTFWTTEPPTPPPTPPKLHLNVWQRLREPSV